MNMSKRWVRFHMVLSYTVSCVLIIESALLLTIMFFRGLSPVGVITTLGSAGFSILYATFGSSLQDKLDRMQLGPPDAR